MNWLKFSLIFWVYTELCNLWYKIKQKIYVHVTTLILTKIDDDNNDINHQPKNNNLLLCMALTIAIWITKSCLHKLVFFLQLHLSLFFETTKSSICFSCGLYIKKQFLDQSNQYIICLCYTKMVIPLNLLEIFYIFNMMHRILILKCIFILLNFKKSIFQSKLILFWKIQWKVGGMSLRRNSVLDFIKKHRWKVL